ncbi:MAG: aminoacetone oxidase family FAD-binding enzyme [Firmicutes bacterium]|nr:aminoacetone oxidase family FAD-binding enzyme [Bacillota bacterium]
MKMKNNYDIAILGAGAAGLMAAIAARPLSPSIAILEKNEIAGKKLYATGSGRCNVLNRTAAPEVYRSGEGDAAGFVSGVFAQCGPSGLRDIFESLGLDTVEEDEGRLYPRSLQAASVVRALERGAFGSGGAGNPAELVSGFEAKTVTRGADDLFCVTSADGRNVFAKRLIVATGGKAGIQYGSDGRGLKIAESFGHSIVRPIPALSGLVCEEAELMQKLAGVRAHGTVRLYAQEGGKETPLSEDTGEIQFTKDAVSGICVMNVSGFYRRKGDEKFILAIDLMPEIEEAALAEKLAARKAQLSDYFLDALLPEKLAAAILELTEGQPAEALAHLLKDLRFTPIASKGWKDAHTTSGGVALDDVDAKTLESKIVPGLYFAGEALDVDGPCGGYSLTWAFASGRIAGQAASGGL